MHKYIKRLSYSIRNIEGRHPPNTRYHQLFKDKREEQHQSQFVYKRVLLEWENFIDATGKCTTEINRETLGPQLPERSENFMKTLNLL